MTPDVPLSASIDTLSAVGRQLLRLDAASSYSRLVVDGSPGNEVARTMLENLSPNELIDGSVVSRPDAESLLAALWLRHDWLEQSHRVSQHIETPSGALWHAIMHRREGDFSNSKYWYNLAEGHPVYQTLAVRVGDVTNPYPADTGVFRLTAHGWNPSAFVDLVEQVYQHADDPKHRLAQSIQELEWQTLFQHCTRAASGK